MKTVNLYKAFELGCLDTSCKKYLKPSITDMFFCVEVNDGLVIALSKYDNYAKIRFVNIEQTITNEDADKLIKLFDTQGISENYTFNEAASFLVNKFGEQILNTI